MKTKTAIITLLLLALIIPLILTGCGNDQPNNNSAAHQPTLYDATYQPTLSEMTDQAIRDRIDELYRGCLKLEHPNDYEAFRMNAHIIQIFQNELILRQLEGSTITNTEKQELKGLHKKQGLQGLDKALKGLQ